MVNILPKAVLFDWDGTLVDTYDLLEQSHDYALSSLGLPPREKGWFMPYFGGQRDWIYNDVYGAQHDARARVLFEEFFLKHHKDLITPIAGAERLLLTLSALQIPMAVVSNKKPEYVRPEITAMEWDRYFGSIIGAGMAPKDKPDGDSILMGMRELSLPSPPSQAQDVWYIGDSENDVLAACAAGCSVLYLETSRGAEHLPSPPDRVFSDCKDINYYVLSLA